MVRRALVPLIAGAALVLPVALPGGLRSGPPAAHAVTAGTAAATASTAEVLVQWVIRTEDLLACRSVTPELRRMQHQHAGRVRVVAYPVSSDTALVRSFLRRERLGLLEVQSISEREFRREFAHHLDRPAQLPALIVRSPGARVAAFDAGVRAAREGRGVSGFAAHLRDLLDDSSPRLNDDNTRIAAGGD